MDKKMLLNELLSYFSAFPHSESLRKPNTSVHSFSQWTVWTAGDRAALKINAFLLVASLPPRACGGSGGDKNL